MKKFFKHSGLLLAYYIAYQFGSQFLQLPWATEQVEGIPASAAEGLYWFGLIVGLPLLIGFSYLLWKVLYPRKTMSLTLDKPWLKQIAYPLLAYLAFFILQFLLPVPESDNQKNAVAFIQSAPIHSFFLVVIFAGIFEELIFRGFLATYFFPKMADMKVVGIYLAVTGSLFSLVHMPATLPQFLIYFTMGLNLGWLYLIRRDIRYPIALHMLNNGISYFMIVFLV
ncbi:TPA: lysostaphin resistance A-like protein [Streptococcus suis]